MALVGSISTVLLVTIFDPSTTLVHAAIIVTNYLILALLRATATRLFQHEVPLFRERVLFPILYSGSTINTICTLLLPPLLTKQSGEGPVACCLHLEDPQGRNSTELLGAMEAYSNDVFWYFVMSGIGSQLYRCGWEYWEQHQLVGWAVIRRLFYSPTELYGTREDLAHMCSVFTTSIAFGLLNP
eukprot:SAG11_NODE_13264_length_662_cov_1.358792_1_plen_184_part_01